MKYTVIQANSIKQLIILVNEAIIGKYIPIGGVSCMVDYYRAETYTQAMVLKEGN